MNRLWVRLTGLFSIVVLAVTLAFGVAFVVLGFDAFQPDVRLIEAAASDAERAAVQVLIDAGTLARAVQPVQPAYNIPVGLLRVGLLVALTAALAGGLASHSVTRPLDRLQSAANAIGRHDLTSRIPVQGTVEMRAVAEAFNQMAADLQAAEQSRTQLLNDVAHELRTPLTVIQGNLRAILDDVYPLTHEEVAVIYEQTRHLGHLVQDLRDLAQAEAHQLALHIAPIAPTEWLKEIATAYRPLLEDDGLRFIANLPADLPAVQGDRQRLTQCLANLLINARNYTPAGGTITLAAAQQADGLQIIVQDTGQGIAPEYLSHLFDRFYRVPSEHDDQQHSGLGLAIAASFAALHGGTLSASSPGLGQGSCFTLTLPLRHA